MRKKCLERLPSQGSSGPVNAGAIFEDGSNSGIIDYVQLCSFCQKKKEQFLNIL